MEKVILTDAQKAMVDSKATEILANENRSKVYGAEGLEVGDEFILTPNAEGKLVLGGTFGRYDFLRFACTGDRSTISASALLGSAKPRKYFASAGYSPEFAKDYDSAKALADAWKPEVRNEKEIIPYMVANYVGAKFTCIASCDYTAEIDGQEQDMHTYLFKVEMPK